MTTTATTAEGIGIQGGRAALSKSSRRTLDAVYARPVAHNLEWADVIALFAEIGSVEHKTNDDTVLQVGAEHQSFRRSRGKDLLLDDVMAIRHFLTRVGQALQHSTETADFLVTIEHHEAKVYHLDLRADDPANHTITPYDPHHFLHHLTHKDQSREHGQRGAEDPTFYERISQAIAEAAPHGRIVVVGHGKGHSDAARHFIEWVNLHHDDISRRLFCEVVGDLSSLTPPQLLDLGRRALSDKPT
jgi:hypothetical protein